MTSEGQSRPQRCVVIQNGNQPTQPKMTVPKSPELKAMEKDRIEKLFPKKMRRILSFMQLYLGGVAGLLQIILVGMESTGSRNSNGMADWGAGIWCGLAIGIAGGIGLITTNSPSRKSIKALLVLNIFAAFFAMVLTGFSWSGIFVSRLRSYIDGIILFCVLVLIGLAEGIVSIMTVSFACRVLSEPNKTWMTSEHVAIPMTATSSNVQVPLNDTSKDFEYALRLQEEEEALNGNQPTPTITVPKYPKLKMENASAPPMSQE